MTDAGASAGGTGHDPRGRHRVGEPQDVCAIRRDDESPTTHRTDRDDMCVNYVSTACAYAVEHRAHLPGEAEVGVHDPYCGAAPPLWVVPRDRGFDAAGPSDPPAHLRADDRRDKHIPIPRPCLPK